MNDITQMLDKLKELFDKEERLYRELKQTKYDIELLQTLIMYQSQKVK